jgi:hypothetical protein
MMSQVMESEVRQARSFPQGPPCRPPTLLWSGGINVSIFTGWKGVVVWRSSSDFLRSVIQLHDGFECVIVQRNYSPTSVGLAVTDRDRPLQEINIPPLKPFHFTSVHSGA